MSRRHFFSSAGEPGANHDRGWVPPSCPRGTRLDRCWTWAPQRCRPLGFRAVTESRCGGGTGNALSICRLVVIATHAHRFAATEMSTLQVCSSRHPLSRGEFDFTVYLSATLFSSEHVKQHSCNAPRSRPAQRVNAMRVTRRRNFGRISTHSRTLLCSSLGRLVLLLAYGLNSP